MALDLSASWPWRWTSPARGSSSGCERDRVAFLSNPRPCSWLSRDGEHRRHDSRSESKLLIDELRYFVDDAEPKLLIGIGRDGEGEHAEALRDGLRSAFIERSAPTLAEREDEAFASWETWLAEGRDVAEEESLALAGPSRRWTGIDRLYVGKHGSAQGRGPPPPRVSYCAVVQVERWQ